MKNNKKLQFRRDGYDYVAIANGTEYRVSKAYDTWCVRINDEEQDEYFNYFADAKEWCQNHNNK